MNSCACERVAASVSSKLFLPRDASTPKTRHRTDAVGKRGDHRSANLSAGNAHSCREDDRGLGVKRVVGCEWLVSRGS